MTVRLISRANRIGEMFLLLCILNVDDTSIILVHPDIFGSLAPGPV